MGHPLLELKERTAIVVGGTSGIRLAHQGTRSGRSERSTHRPPRGIGQERRIHVEKLGGRSLVAPCDVYDNSSLDHLLQVVGESFGSVDVTVARNPVQFSTAVARMGCDAECSSKTAPR
jgi:NAD(P)-dependent dehydrogenase (short-subunit alcohol dehydrogenase family)